MVSVSSNQDTIQAFEQLTTDEKLGLLWVLYDGMGDSITPAAPGAAGEQFTQKLLTTVKEMEHDQQLEFMRDLVNRSNTEHTQAYGAFTNDSKLVFWYELAELMRQGEVIPVPENYELPENATSVFRAIAAMDFNEQITVLRHAVLDMGANA
ncbi:MAG: orange carotenoid protein N-terminal domain-containing protein [Cyanobacteria bacterium P01_A01_bin.114]